MWLFYHLVQATSDASLPSEYWLVQRPFFGYLRLQFTVAPLLLASPQERHVPPLDLHFWTQRAWSTPLTCLCPIFCPSLAQVFLAKDATCSMVFPSQLAGLQVCDAFACAAWSLGPRWISCHTIWTDISNGQWIACLLPLEPPPSFGGSCRVFCGLV